jgi:DNA-directed RNA polymerase specialized sigma24 family protein
VLGPRSATDDLLQETLIRVFRLLLTFRGEALLSTWIGRIALRVAFEHLRRARLDPLVAAHVGAAREETP